MKTNVGYRLFAVDDRVQDVRIPVAFIYPTDAPTSALRFGPYSIEASHNAPVKGENLPLVVVSHGNNGSPWTLRGLAVFLASSGYVVALPEHIGNSQSDSSLSGTADNLTNRPRHISLTVDAVCADPDFGARLAPQAVAVIGISIGGYTGLAAAGGRPWTGPYDMPAQSPRPVDVRRDLRIKALVLLAPATAWFMAEGSLRDVDVPILMRTGERDEITPAWQADIVMNGIPDMSRIEHQVVPDAGHFSFLSPFPSEMRRSDFPPSQDPAGFDRAAFQPVLHADVLNFLRRVLGAPAV